MLVLEGVEVQYILRQGTTYYIHTIHTYTYTTTYYLHTTHILSVSNDG
jgi:hypothetical protein